MPFKMKVAGTATMILSSLALGAAGIGSLTANAQPGAYEAPVMLKADEAVALSASPTPSAPAQGSFAASPAPTHAVLDVEDDDDAPRPISLAALVAEHDDSDALDPEENCLATAIYYEARSESLAGQLAVARVVVNRAASGRFPGSLCGVVKQPGQFSFVRGGALPSANRNATQWRNARAIAEIAMENGWKSQAEGALFFHASRLSPGWGRQKLTQIDNHVFYR